MAKKKGFNKLVRKFGSDGRITRKEALKIQNKTGRDLGQIGFAANNRGIGLGAALANRIGSQGFVGGAYKEGAGDWMRGIQGIDLAKGQLFYGSTKQTSPSSRGVNEGYMPGKTSYSPIVGMKNMTIGGAKQNDPSGGGKGKKNKNKSGGPMEVGGQDSEWRGGYRNQTKDEILDGYSSEDADATDMTDTTATDVEQPTEVDSTMPTLGSMAGGGAGASGATGLRRKNGRLARLGIRRQGTGGMNRSNKFFSQIN